MLYCNPPTLSPNIVPYTNSTQYSMTTKLNKMTALKSNDKFFLIKQSMMKTTPMVCNIVFKVFTLYVREQVLICSIYLKINQLLNLVKKTVKVLES